MNPPFLRPAAFLLALATMSSAPLPAANDVKPAHDFFAYFGTGRSGANLGFSVAHFDADTGALTVPALAPTATAPNIFIFSSDGRHLYTCHAGRTFEGQPGGGVSAFAVDPATGALTLLNSAPSGGADPGYVSLDRTGRFLFVANYNGGSIAVFALQPDGSLGARTFFDQHTGSSVNPTRQNHAYCEAIFTDASNRFVLSTDLGLDKIFIYRFDEKTGALTPGETPFATIALGSGPRHAAFGAGDKFLLVVGEMSSTVTTYAWYGGKGTLSEIQTVSTVPENFKGNNNPAEVLVHANGKFLYISNRGHDSLAVFALDEKTGRLSLVQHVPTAGKTPRCFSFDPTGKWLVVSNQASNNAVVFRVDAATGKLTQQGEPVAVPNPLQAQFRLDLNRTVFLQGGVRNPGAYIIGSTTTVGDLITNNLTNLVYNPLRILVTRPKAEGGTELFAIGSFRSFLTTSQSKITVQITGEFLLKAGDTVFVYEHGF
jgi:6-phosphogluconolactonase